MCAILSYADKRPQEKESVRKCLIVMFPQHDKKSEPIWMLGLGAEQSANRQELVLCLAIGKAEGKFYMPMNNNMGQTSLQNLWGTEMLTVQMSSSFTFSLLAA